MKLFLILCIAFLNFQFSVQEGYHGTHVYHDGDENQEHNPLPSDVEQLSRSREKRPEHTTANPLRGNKKSDENRNHDNEQSSANESKTTELSKQGLESNEKLNTTPRPNDEKHRNPATSGQQYTKPTINDVKPNKPTSQQYKNSATNDGKPEKPTTSGQVYEKLVNDDTKLKKPATSSQQYEHSVINVGKPEKSTTSGQEHKKPVTNGVQPAKPPISGQQYGNPATNDAKSEKPATSGQRHENSATTNNNGVSNPKTGKIYETYPEAYEGITGKKYQNSSSSNGSSSNIDVGKIGQIDSRDKKTDDLEHGQKPSIYENYVSAYENITGKHYEGSASKDTASNKSTGELEHGQTQKIFDNHTTAYEEITGKHYEGSQSNNNSSAPGKIPGNNSQKDPSSANHGGLYIECSPGHTKCQVQNYEPEVNKGNHQSSTQGHSYKIPGGISIIVQDSSMIYLPPRTVVQKLPCPPVTPSTPSDGKSTPENNNAGSRETKSTNGLERGPNQKLYDNYTTAYEEITGKKYKGAEPPYDRTYSVVQV